MEKVKQKNSTLGIVELWCYHPEKNEDKICNIELGVEDELCKLCCSWGRRNRTQQSQTKYIGAKEEATEKQSWSIAGDRVGFD
ncbi:MAG: hypothetical protein PHP64_08430 [Actinomycetota bacterium]|nr:hypothetical protein [Actinomycetota bacterium]